MKKVQGSCFPVFVALSAILLMTGWAFGQEEAYRIGPRDVIGLAVFAGGEEQVGIDVTVSNEGMINVPFLGPVKAAGLTTTELENQIFEPLALDYFVDPEVNVLVKEYNSLYFYISGAIGEPGLHKTKSRPTLIQLIVQAGGVTDNRGKTAYILRDNAREFRRAVEDADSTEEAVENLLANNARFSVDLDRLLEQGDMTQNLPLESGDLVYISLEQTQDVAEYKVYVEGEVGSPGVYPYQPGMTAHNAVLIAGGFGKYAAPGRTRVIRKSDGERQVIRIDLDRVREGEIQDLQLKPGDLVNVPESWF